VRIFQDLREPPRPIPPRPRERLGLVGPRYLPSIRTLRMIQSPLQRWSRDRHTSFWEIVRPLHGACHTMRGLGRSCSVFAATTRLPTFLRSKWLIAFLSELPLRRCAMKNSVLGHRSLAPATFFEVRFAGLFEARRRLSTSATNHDARARPPSESSSQDEGRNLLPTLATALSSKPEKRPRGASLAHPVVIAPAPFSPAYAGLRRRYDHPASRE